MLLITVKGDVGSITAHSESLSAATSKSAVQSCQVAASRGQPLSQGRPHQRRCHPSHFCLRHLQIFLAAHRTDLHSP